VDAGYVPKRSRFLTPRVFLPYNKEVAEIRPYGESSVVAQTRLFPLTTGAFFCLQSSVTTRRWRNCAKVAIA
jgi:hypothetical protein